MAKLSVEETLLNARLHTKKEKTAEAQRLYQTDLEAVPRNRSAQQDLSLLNKPSIVQSPPQEAVNQLTNLYNQGQLPAVIKQAQALTKQYPSDAFIWNIWGAAAAQIDKLDQAVFAFQKVISLKPDYVEAYNNLGNALTTQGKLDEAIEAYKAVLLLQPNYADAYNNMGNTLTNQGKLEEAVEAYKTALSLNPDYVAAYNNMGAALRDQGKLDEAIEACNKVIALQPDYADAYNNIGVTLKKQGKLDEAIQAYKTALSLQPNYADAYNNMGNVLTTQGKLDEAIQAYKTVLFLQPNYADAYNNMGNALTDQGKLDEAIQAYKTALSLQPNYADAYTNLGAALNDQGKLDEAIEAYNNALALEPDHVEAHYNLSFIFLNCGRLREGLDEYEWRWKTVMSISKQRHFSQPLWDGKKSLKGKRILLWCEQGVGDTINWSSCLSHVASEAEYCIMECQDKLVPLLARSFPNVEVKPENSGLDLQRHDFDFHLPMGSLYRHFISKISQKPKANAFLVPDPTRVNFWRERLVSLGHGPYVGISWKSSNMSPARLPNYAPISEWSPILTLPGITFINLQYQDFVDDLTQVKNELGVTVHNFDDLDHYDNLLDVAALSAALDIVVSTKNTVPLITAGVGTLTKLANWRQSDWNNILFNPVGPSLDIFERNTWEPWGNTFRLIAADIVKLKNKTSDLGETL